MRLSVFIKRFFDERGCTILDFSEVSIPSELLRENDLIVQDAKNLIVIKVIEGELNRNLLMDVALKAAALREYVDKVYLAIPSKFRLIVDGRALVSNGIGILIVGDEGDVTEVIPAKPKTSKIRNIPDLSKLSALTQRVESLERRVEGLENSFLNLKELSREVEKLKREISLLREELRSLGSVKAREVERAPPPAPEITPVRELPSYLRDNPWLEILSRRGKER